MSIYKKQINKIEQARNVEYVMSNNNGIYMTQTVIGENKAPYHGLLIKQNETQDEIYLSKMVEQFKINKKIHVIKDIDTNEEKFGGAEYLEEFERYPLPLYKYNIEDVVKFEKKYVFSDDNVLCINYHIVNNDTHDIGVKLLPLVSIRDIMQTKRESMLKLNATQIANGAKINLSIMQKKYLYLKSKNSTFKNKPHYINGIKYNLEIDDDTKKTYVDDMFIPGYFEINIKPNTVKDINIYVSEFDVDINSDRYDVTILSEEQIEKNKMMTIGIDDNFYELKQLALSASQLNYIDNDNKKFVLLKGIPNIRKNSKQLSHVIKSIYGNYILLKKYKEAYRILCSIKQSLEKDKTDYTKQEYYELIFMYIEALSKYINTEECTSKEKIDMYMYIREKVTDILCFKDDEKIIDDKYVITIDSKQYLRINIYWYNALKIYLSLAKEDDEYFNKIYNITEKLRENLIDIFFCDEERVLKYEASERPYANSDMLISMDLTYPLIYDKIAMKIIDTAFKSLYTPLGMRKFAIDSDKYDGYIYPYLMTTFVNANLRQNGVTRATQKIAYNLVKDLFAEINKQTVGSIKYRYHEKSKKAYGGVIDSLTNAEFIRLYNMLT